MERALLPCCICQVLWKYSVFRSTDWQHWWILLSLWSIIISCRGKRMLHFVFWLVPPFLSQPWPVPLHPPFLRCWLLHFPAPWCCGAGLWEHHLLHSSSVPLAEQGKCCYPSLQCQENGALAGWQSHAQEHRTILCCSAIRYCWCVWHQFRAAWDLRFGVVVKRRYMYSPESLFSAQFWAWLPLTYRLAEH